MDKKKGAYKDDAGNIYATGEGPLKCPNPQCVSSGYFVRFESQVVERRLRISISDSGREFGYGGQNDKVILSKPDTDILCACCGFPVAEYVPIGYRGVKEAT